MLRVNVQLDLSNPIQFSVQNLDRSVNKKVDCNAEIECLTTLLYTPLQQLERSANLSASIRKNGLVEKWIALQNTFWS